MTAPLSAADLPAPQLAAILRAAHAPDVIVWRTADAVLTTEQAAVAMETGSLIGDVLAAWMRAKFRGGLAAMRIRALPKPEALRDERRMVTARLRAAEDGYLEAHGWTSRDGEAWVDPCDARATMSRRDAIATQRERVATEPGACS